MLVCACQSTVLPGGPANAGDALSHPDVELDAGSAGDTEPALDSEAPELPLDTFMPEVGVGEDTDPAPDSEQPQRADVPAPEDVPEPADVGPPDVVADSEPVEDVEPPADVTPEEDAPEPAETVVPDDIAADVAPPDECDAPCDDGNPCTVDTCVDGACKYGFTGAECDDGEPCTAPDLCSEGTCVGALATVCDDGLMCTLDACEPGVGCLYTPDDVACDDNNSCTDDTCGAGCVHFQNSILCNDDDVCTTLDGCVFGACLGGLPQSCDDNNPCTADSCDPTSGCQNAPIMASAAPPETVFAPVDTSVELGADALANGNLSFITGVDFDDWVEEGTGWTLDFSTSHSPPYSGHVIATGAPGDHGASQLVVLNQSEPAPLLVSGWGRGEALTGDSGFVGWTITVTFADGTSTVEALPLPVGTFDWQPRSVTIKPSKSVTSLLFRATASGVVGDVWFDTMRVYPVLSAVLSFEGEAIAASEPDSVQPGCLGVVSNDGTVSLILNGSGQVTGLTAGGQDVHAPAAAPFSGLLIRDQSTPGQPWLRIAGSAQSSGPNVTQQAVVGEAGAEVTAHYLSGADHLQVDVIITPTDDDDRVWSVYLALPVQGGGTFGADINTELSTATGSASNTTKAGNPEPFGATGSISRVPIGPITYESSGLTLGYPLTVPRLTRLSYEADPGLLVMAVDVAGPSTFRALIYSHKPDWGFRAALQRYYEISPESFGDRAEKHGLYVTHGDPAGIEDPQDFGFAFHQLAGDQLALAASDTQAGITPLREALSVSQSVVSLPADTDPYDPVQVLGHLTDQVQEGDLHAMATVASAVHDASDVPLITGCPAPAQCARVVVNGDPTLDPSPFPQTWTALHWPDSASDLAQGEVMLDLGAAAGTCDYRATHVEAAAVRTWTTAERRPCVPGAWSAAAVLSSIGADVVVADGLRAATAELSAYGFWAGHLDVLNSRRDFWPGGVWNPDPDWLMSLRRTLMGPKPVSVTLATDLSNLTHAEVEQALRYCLFYGVFPTFEAAYWADEALVARDRDLFHAWIPEIRSVSEAGWQPVTEVLALPPGPRVERWGAAPDAAYLTVLNPLTDAWSGVLSVTAAGLEQDLSVTLAPGETRRIPLNP